MSELERERSFWDLQDFRVLKKQMVIIIKSQNMDFFETCNLSLRSAPPHQGLPAEQDKWRNSFPTVSKMQNWCNPLPHLQEEASPKLECQ